MQDTPHRLKPERARLLGSATEGAPPLPLRERHIIRQLRAARRSVLILLWTVFAVVIQAVLLVLPGRPKVVFARWFWRGVCLLFGVSLRQIGHAAGTGPYRPAAGSAARGSVVYVSNHSSWLDIAVLGALLEACFVSKDDVASWPGISTIARLGRTVFVTRKVAATGRERDVMSARLAAGDSLVLFPEGTSSDGSRVLPFRTTFFALAEGEAPPMIQPVSVVYDRLGGLPAGRTARPVFAWYGDMDLAPHYWRLIQWGGMRASVLLHPPLDPRHYASRKELAQAAWQAVADGASLLRQNRPVPAEQEAGPLGALTPAEA